MLLCYYILFIFSMYCIFNIVGKDVCDYNTGGRHFVQANVSVRHSEVSV